jgi:hypothetical protein
VGYYLTVQIKLFVDSTQALHTHHPLLTLDHNPGTLHLHANHSRSNVCHCVAAKLITARVGGGGYVNVRLLASFSVNIVSTPCSR